MVQNESFKKKRLESGIKSCQQAANFFESHGHKISRQLISAWENGTEPSLSSLRKIASAYRLTDAEIAAIVKKTDNSGGVV